MDQCITDETIDQCNRFAKVLSIMKLPNTLSTVEAVRKCFKWADMINELIHSGILNIQTDGDEIRSRIEDKSLNMHVFSNPIHEVFRTILCSHVIFFWAGNYASLVFDEAIKQCNARLGIELTQEIIFDVMQDNVHEKRRMVLRFDSSVPEDKPHINIDECSLAFELLWSLERKCEHSSKFSPMSSDKMHRHEILSSLSSLKCTNAVLISQECITAIREVAFADSDTLRMLFVSMCLTPCMIASLMTTHSKCRAVMTEEATGSMTTLHVTQEAMMEKFIDMTSSPQLLGIIMDCTRANVLRVLVMDSNLLLSCLLASKYVQFGNLLVDMILQYTCAICKESEAITQNSVDDEILQIYIESISILLQETHVFEVSKQNKTSLTIVLGDLQLFKIRRKWTK